MSGEGTPAPAGGTPAAGDAWFAGITGEDLGYIQNRGYDKLAVKDVALAAIKGHREAEKLIGAPADQLLRMPKDTADAEGITRLRDRLGVPKEAKDYDFSAVKVGDKPLDAGLVEKLAPSLIDANVSKAAAPAVAKAVADYLAAQDTETSTARAAAAQTERDALKVNWGTNVEANMLVAKGAAAALNVDPAAVAALENQIGYAKVMEMFRVIGTKIGEDQFVSNGGGGSPNNILSVDQAQATMTQRQGDTAWVAKLNAGDAATLREFNALTTVIAAAGVKR